MASMRVALVAAVGWALLLLAASTAAQTPEERFAGLERRLIEAQAVRVVASIESRGAVASSVQGHLHWGPDGRCDYGFKGTFIDAPLAVTLSCADGRLTGGTAAQPVDRAIPPALAESFLLGLTRMGLLHNVAVTGAGGGSPDRADGGMREWVVLSGFESRQGEPIEGRPVEGIHFQLSVGGRPSGEATLWLDAETGLPLRREQRTQFPNGDMHVVERYGSIELQ